MTVMLKLGSFKPKTGRPLKSDFLCQSNFQRSWEKILCYWQGIIVKHFIEYFRQYLFGQEFIVRLDHQALNWLSILKIQKED